MPWSNPGPAKQVVIAGPGGLLLVYKGTPGPGTLALSIAAAAGTDPYGNTYGPGLNMNPAFSQGVFPEIGAISWSIGDASAGGINQGPAGATHDLTVFSPGVHGASQTFRGNGNIDIDGGDGLGKLMLTTFAEYDLGDTLGLIRLGGPGFTGFKGMQFNSFTSSFAAVNSTSGTVTFPQAFPAGTVPNVQATVTVGANLDILFNQTGAATSTGFPWRLFQKGGVNVTGTVTVNWMAIG